MLSGSFPIFVLSNYTTCCQTQTFTSHIKLKSLLDFSLKVLSTHYFPFV
jgi:hypothetical protein